MFGLLLSPLVMLLFMIFDVIYFFTIDRVIYYWMISIFLLFSYFCSYVLHRVRRRALKAFFLLFIVVISFVYIYQSYTRMCIAVRYYTVLNRDLMDAFNWLESHADGDDLILCSEYSWSVWFRALKKDLNITYSRNFLWGRFLVYSPYFLVADNYPVEKANPEIGFRYRGGYEKVFFVDDDFVEMRCSPLGSDEIYRFVLSDAPVREFTFLNSSSRVRLCEVGIWNDTVIRRSVVVYNDSRFVDLIFEAFCNDSAYQELSFWIWGSYGRIFSDVNVEGFNVSLCVSILGTRISFYSRITIEEVIGNVTGFKVVLGHPEFKIHGMRYVVSSDSGHVMVRLRVWNLCEYPKLIWGRVILIDTIQYLYDLNVTYILMRRSYVKDVPRLLHYGFEKVYERGNVLILRRSFNETS